MQYWVAWTQKCTSIAKTAYNNCIKLTDMRKSSNSNNFKLCYRQLAADLLIFVHFALFPSEWSCDCTSCVHFISLWRFSRAAAVVLLPYWEWTVTAALQPAEFSEFPLEAFSGRSAVSVESFPKLHIHCMLHTWSKQAVIGVENALYWMEWWAR